MFGGENINYAVSNEHGPRTLPGGPLLAGTAAY
jgi:hypothetical protein